MIRGGIADEQRACTWPHRDAFHFMIGELVIPNEFQKTAWLMDDATPTRT
jgi:hypothetical protein